MSAGSGRRRLRAGSNALQIAVRLVELHGGAAADCGCQTLSSVQRRRTELARWKSLDWEAGARFTVRPGHGPGTLRGSKGRSGVSLENEVGGRGPLHHFVIRSCTRLRYLQFYRRLVRCWQRLVRFMLTGWLTAAMDV